MIPKGDSLLFVGDYLTILTNEDYEDIIRERLSSLAHENID